MEQSIALRKYMLEKELYNAINNSGIPVCFVADIVQKLYTNVHSAARKDLEAELERVGEINEANDGQSI